MESPASSCSSKQAPDESTTLNLEAAGIKSMLPDPCTAEAGMEPELPEPEEAACTKMMKLLEAGRVPKLPEACGNKTKLEAQTEPEMKLEDAPLSPAPAWGDKAITPLSGSHPFFSIVLSRCHVDKSFQLAIPTRLLGLLPEARVPAVLLCGGRSWATSYCGDLKCKKFEVASWRVFAVDNRLRVGDACVFELVGRRNSGEKALVFRVQVLRGDLPEEVTSRGATSDQPLVIVD